MDHWHALIGTACPLTISQMMHNVKWISARLLNDKRGLSGPVWVRQFGDRFVRHEKELGARLANMQLNPARKGLVCRPEEWRWSGYNNFVLDEEPVRRCPIRIDYLRLPEGYHR